mmetsp:Transcript_89301/g.247999  ORF Transcript_89301/g.247999 Transcript_89301/m.247999 type:complete len:261 (+) Transcript_89301:73-855(+)
MGTMSIRMPLFLLLSLEAQSECGIPSVVEAEASNNTGWRCTGGWCTTSCGCRGSLGTAPWCCGDDNDDICLNNVCVPRCPTMTATATTRTTSTSTATTTTATATTTTATTTTGTTTSATTTTTATTTLTTTTATTTPTTTTTLTTMTSTTDTSTTTTRTTTTTATTTTTTTTTRTTTTTTTTTTTECGAPSVVETEASNNTGWRCSPGGWCTLSCGCRGSAGTAPWCYGDDNDDVCLRDECFPRCSETAVSWATMETMIP